MSKEKEQTEEVGFPASLLYIVIGLAIIAFPILWFSSLGGGGYPSRPAPYKLTSAQSGPVNMDTKDYQLDKEVGTFLSKKYSTPVITVDYPEMGKKRYVATDKDAYKSHPDYTELEHKLTNNQKDYIDAVLNLKDYKYLKVERTDRGYQLQNIIAEKDKEALDKYKNDIGWYWGVGIVGSIPLVLMIGYGVYYVLAEGRKEREEKKKFLPWKV